jgi:sugar phosphate isomerase/epimerase
MNVKLLCPQWGHEQLAIELFVEQVKATGYDGIETWVPEDSRQRKQLKQKLEEYSLVFVAHQFRATGSAGKNYCRSFQYHLSQAMELEPIQINSHSGHDWFDFDQQLEVIDVAAEFEISQKIRVLHETHRGRMGFSPAAFYALATARPAMRITADFSHWVCVTESYLEGFSDIISLAMDRTSHIHARVGFPQGPQVPDPRLPQYQEAWKQFTGWWTEILIRSYRRKETLLTITPEFGPPPYMWTNALNRPVASQWEINKYIHDWFRTKIASINSNE